MRACASRLNAGNPSAVSDDEVNLAAAFIAMNNYAEAWEAAQRARQLAPENIMPWTPLIAILNRKGDRVELRRVLSSLLGQRPDVLDDPIFRDHIENDMDFIGIKELVEELKASVR